MIHLVKRFCSPRLFFIIYLFTEVCPISLRICTLSGFNQSRCMLRQYIFKDVYVTEEKHISAFPKSPYMFSYIIYFCLLFFSFCFSLRFHNLQTMNQVKWNALPFERSWVVAFLDVFAKNYSVFSFLCFH